MNEVQELIIKPKDPKDKKGQPAANLPKRPTGPVPVKQDQQPENQDQHGLKIEYIDNTKIELVPDSKEIPRPPEFFPSVL